MNISREYTANNKFNPFRRIGNYLFNKFTNLLLFEKNDRLGKKLRITGKGRCNVTNDCDTREFLTNVPTNPRFLYSALSCFSP